MAKRRLPREEASKMIRKGVLDGRFDAGLWGSAAEDGEDAPRWAASRWWRGVGGEPLQDLYVRAYERSFLALRESLWRDRPARLRREAQAAVDHNRILRYETRAEREQRLLRERIEVAEQRFALVESPKNNGLSASRLKPEHGAALSAQRATNRL